MVEGLKDEIAMPGGKDRAREAILYVSWEYRNAPRFGQTKLHKILWRSDFRAFAKRGSPVTGRKYQRLPQGPCLQEMMPLQKSLFDAGLIQINQIDLGGGFFEDRVVTDRRPDQVFLSDDDLFFLDEAIFHYWDKTARDASDEAHGVVWRTHEDKQVLPYELALLTDDVLTGEQRRRTEILGAQRRWQTA